MVDPSQNIPQVPKTSDLKLKSFLERNYSFLLSGIGVFAIAIALSAFFLLNKTPKENVKVSTIQSNITLKKEYNNPFDKKTQYVNPFSSYKNPFDSLSK